MTVIDLDLLEQELSESLDRLLAAVWAVAGDPHGDVGLQRQVADARAEFRDLHRLAAEFGIEIWSAI